MESAASVNGDPNPWSSETNWTVVRGTLVNSITLESSFGGGGGDDDDLKSPAKRCPLILKPNAQDSNPCEITISFAQKHEFRQIYVKSTARVYEIYCQSNLQSEREYVWTVKCSAAARDDDDEVISTCSNGSHDNSSKENLGSESNRTRSEDEWVSVKAPDSSLVLIKPEYYEATAQISDVDPCLSVTLRLLSVQSKESVIVDEVYVFADPIDTTDSKNQVGHNENSNGSSLMAMLLPSLLQMSKTKNSTGNQEKLNSGTAKRPNFQEIASEASFSSSSNVVAKVQNNGNTSTEKTCFQSVNMVDVSGTELQSLPQVSARESKVDKFPTSDRVERSLDQLFSRIDRIEDLFLRLEENLLKPINSIEARLGRVEQQLEVLTNKPKNTEQPSYSRFWAPNFSSILSDSNSLSRSEADYQPRSEEIESNAKRFHPENQTNQADDICDIVNTTQLVPCLAVSAPHYPNGDDDDEEENQASDIVAESSLHQPKRALTVDDALALALAGLTIQAKNHTPAFSIKAPEFLNDEDTEADEKDSPSGQEDVGTGLLESQSGSLSNESNPSLASALSGSMIQAENYTPALSIKAPEYSNTEDPEANAEDLPKGQQDVGADGTKKENDLLSKDSNPSMEDDVEKSLDDDHLEKTPKEVDETDENGDTENGEEHVRSPAKNREDASSADPDPDAEVSNDGSEDKKRKSLLETLESSFAAPSTVDFELPVLDVKFLSRDSCESNFSLEALLSDCPESKSREATCSEESLETVPSDNVHCDLISVEDSEPIGPVISSQMSLDFNYCTLEEPLSKEDETPLASGIPCSHDTFPTTLI